jgi:hypothetical protein
MSCLYACLPKHGRFEKRVNLRKFDKYVTDVQVYANVHHGEQEMEEQH